jgi:hypothetical protein
MQMPGGQEDHERIFFWDRNDIQKKVTLAATHMVRYRCVNELELHTGRSKNEFSQA